MACTWFGEICYYCRWTCLPEPAQVVLITFCKPFFRALYQKYNLVQCHIRIALLSGSEGLRATTPYFDYFTVHEYENIDLPCLASHPSIEVILMKVRIRMKMT